MRTFMVLVTARTHASAKVSPWTLHVLRKTPDHKTPGTDSHLAGGQLPQNHAEAEAHTHPGQCRSVLGPRDLPKCQAACQFTSSRSVSQICRTAPVLRRVGQDVIWIGKHVERQWNATTDTLRCRGAQRWTFCRIARAQGADLYTSAALLTLLAVPPMSSSGAAQSKDPQAVTAVAAVSSTRASPKSCANTNGVLSWLSMRHATRSQLRARSKLTRWFTT